MGTRSVIGYMSRIGTGRAVYCHFDGYPEHTGYTLLNYYNDEQAAKDLVDAGPMSGVDSDPSLINHYEDNFPEPTVLTSEKPFFDVDWNDKHGAEWAYVFTPDGWFGKATSYMGAPKVSSPS